MYLCLVSEVLKIKTEERNSNSGKADCEKVFTGVVGERFLSPGFFKQEQSHSVGLF